jgi:hypothetical protein
VVLNTGTKKLGQRASKCYAIISVFISSGERYYGFKGNLLINSEGIITGVTLSQAHIDERESLWDLVGGIHGMIIADKGLIGSEYQNELWEYAGIDLQTAVRSNMEERRGCAAASCMRDESRPLIFGLQELIINHRKLLW